MSRNLLKARGKGPIVPRRTARWRHRTAWFALSTFLFNLLTPLFILAVQPGIGNAAPDLSDTQQITVMNCDGAGMMVMRAGPDGKPPPGKNKYDGFCPLCTIGASYDLTHPVQFAHAPEAGPALPVHLPANADLPRRTMHAVPSAPRAPPLDI